MNTDRELLELAAKAAGFIHINERIENGWNPLTDDGDALRLAVKMREKLILLMPACFGIERFKEWEDDPFAAARRAIVSAVAEIGRAMP